MSLLLRGAVVAAALLMSADALGASFPFTIQDGRFARDGQPVFLNLIGYQPLEPGQENTGEIRAARVLDDLRRLRAYRGGRDPVALRVYAQPTATFPNRMPKAFYDGIRDLDFWVVRDIYFDANFLAGDAVPKGQAAIDAVIAEVAAAGAFDRIFAWEIGNEFQASGSAIPALESFLAAMRDHIKTRMNEPGREAFSDWVTWASWPPSDPLRTGGNPIHVPSLDYLSFNAYSYDPERMRDQQSGRVTGTPYQGYLDAIKDLYPDKPVVVAESGLPDSPTAVGLDQARIPPIAPSYRRGALTREQAAEGIADRYWDARLAGGIAGFCVFEWADEWWKTGNAALQSSDPEESFGLSRYVAGILRFKLQQDVIRDVFTMTLPATDAVISGIVADDTTLAPAGTTMIHATVTAAARLPVRFRWEASRGRIIGASDVAQYVADPRAFGPVTITAVAIDLLGNATQATATLTISAGGPSIEIRTFGTSRSSGRVANVDLTQNKVVLYVRTNQYYVQPFADMKSIWVRNDGYWWSPNFAAPPDAPQLYAWVVPNAFVPPNTMMSAPPGAIASATMGALNDLDNDLLPDAFEPSASQDRYSDPDGDGAANLEEHLNGTNPGAADNDSDGDGLRDTLERLYFATLAQLPAGDPDGDGASNSIELTNQTHPGRALVDGDGDAMPDVWERQRFGNLAQSGAANVDAYELAIPRASFVDDLEANNKSDLFWRNAATGETSVWLMNGATIGAILPSTSVPAPWTPALLADFDGDGRSDVFWHDPSTGETSPWLAWNGAQFAIQVRSVTVPAGWRPAGAGDFDGDGKRDLFWHHTNGETSIWFMNGARFASAIRSITVPPGWTPVLFGDLDGDARTDVFWRNATTGETSIWLMTGVNVGTAVRSFTVATSWAPHGIGDFDGDGKCDLFWRNASTGQTEIWRMDGITRLAVIATTTVPASWTPAVFGDYDGDGHCDVFWRNPDSGETSLWLGWTGTHFTTQVRSMTMPPPWAPVP